MGNFHFAPGRSFSNGAVHVHDLNNYMETPAEAKHTFTHHIHELRFGPELPEAVVKKVEAGPSVWTSHHINPLDGTEQVTDDIFYNYMYFVKVVPTSYLTLGWERNHHGPSGSLLEWLKDIPDEYIDIGEYGHSFDGSVETHQYSVTSHKRSLTGGDDSKEGHKERMHAQGGIPGVFFSYVSLQNSIGLSPRRESISLPFIIHGTDFLPHPPHVSSFSRIGLTKKFLLRRTSPR